MHLGQVYTTKDLEEEKKTLWCNLFMHASATIMNTEMKCIIKKIKKTCGCKLVHFWNIDLFNLLLLIIVSWNGAGYRDYVYT